MLNKRIPLTNMKSHETGRVVDIIGGHGVQDRLKKLGIRLGIKVNKVSTSSRGPVVLRLGGSQVFLGHGMSHKVIVEVDK